MRINSLRKRFERVCERQEERRQVIDATLDELKRQCGYEEAWGYHMRLIPPKVSVARQLAAIEEHLRIEVIWEGPRIVVKKLAKKAKGA